MNAAVIDYAPRSPFGDARLARRACAFILASAALHALTIAAYAPDTGGRAQVHPSQSRTLHAVLTSSIEREPGGIPAVAATSGDAADRKADAADAATPAPRAGPEIPLPEKWHTALEVGTLAQPLVQPVLQYPEALAGSGLSGRVRVKLFIDENGAVQKKEIADAGPHPAFDAAALAAWDGVRFSPALKNGVAVKSQKLLEFNFEP